jgi:UrcA family protein
MVALTGISAYHLGKGGKRHTRPTDGLDRTAGSGRKVRETPLKHYLIGALALALAIPAAAQAASASNAGAEVSVRYNDLDLSQRSDARAMMRRLDRAALQACDARGFSARAQREVVRRSACYQQSMDSAVAGLNAPTVTALHRHRDAISIASN